MWISEKENEFINSEVGNEMEFRTSVAVELSILLTCYKNGQRKLMAWIIFLSVKQPNNMRLSHYSLLYNMYANYGSNTQ